MESMLDSVSPKSTGPRGLQPKPRKRFSFRLKLAVLMLLLLAAGIFVGSRLVILAGRILDNGGLAESFGRLFLAAESKLAGENEGEVRILLLGIGGEQHEGGTLTDTMMLATLKLPQTRSDELRLGLVSIPRDLVVFIPGYDYRKINTAYAFGESGGGNQGPQLAVGAVERLVGKDIPYYAVIDFAGFGRVIDELGSIEVNVEVPFTDTMFPDDQLGYLPPITFEAGRQKMNGRRALQYVRSRHGNNNQGTDFARSRRQQQVLTAVWQKARGLNPFTNFNRLSGVLEAVADNFRTNLMPHEIKRASDLARGLGPENIFSFSLDVESGLLCNQVLEETGAYVIVPCGGLTAYEPIRAIIDNLFTAAVLQKEQPIIELQNASDIPGLADQTRTSLALPHLQIQLGRYQGSAAFLESVIYDNTAGGKPGTLTYLKDKLNIRVAQSAFPFQTATAKPDFVIVLTQKIKSKISE